MVLGQMEEGYEEADTLFKEDQLDEIPMDNISK
jgi:hypothetical protein